MRAICGIFGGYSTYLTVPEIEVIKDLSVVSQLRGMDSAGFVSIGSFKKKQQKNLGVFTIKDAITTSELILDPDFKTLTDNFEQVRCLFGHCRAATIGKVNEENSHPFLHEHIVGVHNGTLVGKIADVAKLQERTDSDLLYELIATEGLQAALDKAGTLSAYALVWYDMKEETINFLRNDKRPLWFMQTKGGGTTYWASERIFLEMIDIRSGAQRYEEPALLPVDTLVTHKLRNGAGIDTKVMKPTPPPPVVITPRRPFTPIWGKKEVKPTVHQTSHYKTGRYYGFNNKILARGDAETILEEGCAWCNCIPPITESVTFFSHKDFLCQGCASIDDFAIEYCLKDKPIFLSRWYPQTVPVYTPLVEETGTKPVEDIIPFEDKTNLPVPVSKC